MKCCETLDPKTQDIIRLAFLQQIPLEKSTLPFSFTNLFPEIHPKSVRYKELSPSKLEEALQLNMFIRLPILSSLKENKSSILITKENKEIAYVIIIQSLCTIYLSDVSCFDLETLRLFFKSIHFALSIDNLSQENSEIICDQFFSLFKSVVNNPRIIELLPSITKILTKYPKIPTEFLPTILDCSVNLMQHCNEKISKNTEFMIKGFFSHVIKFLNTIDDTRSVQWNQSIFKFCESANKFFTQKGKEIDFDFSFIVLYVYLHIHYITDSKDGTFEQYIFELCQIPELLNITHSKEEEKPFLFFQCKEPTIEEMSVNRELSIDTESLDKGIDDFTDGTFQKVVQSFVAFPDYLITHALKLIINYKNIDYKMKFFVIYSIAAMKTMDGIDFSSFINVDFLFFDAQFFNPAETVFSEERNQTVLFIRKTIYKALHNIIFSNPDGKISFQFLTVLNSLTIYPVLTAEIISFMVSDLQKLAQSKKFTQFVNSCLTQNLSALRYGFYNGLNNSEKARVHMFNVIRSFSEDDSIELCPLQDTILPMLFETSFSKKTSDVLSSILVWRLCNEKNIQPKKIIDPVFQQIYLFLMKGNIDTSICIYLLDTVFNGLSAFPPTSLLDYVEESKLDSLMYAVLGEPSVKKETLKRILMIMHLATKVNPAHEFKLDWMIFNKVLSKFTIDDELYNLIKLIVSAGSSTFRVLSISTFCMLYPILASSHRINLMKEIETISNNYMAQKYTLYTVGYIDFLLDSIEKGEFNEEEEKIAINTIKSTATHACNSSIIQRMMGSTKFLPIIESMLDVESSSQNVGLFSGNSNSIHINNIHVSTEEGFVVSLDILIQFYKMIPTSLLCFTGVFECFISHDELTLKAPGSDDFSVTKELPNNEFFNITFVFNSSRISVYVNESLFYDFTHSKISFVDTPQGMIFLNPLPGSSSQCLMKRMVIANSNTFCSNCNYKDKLVDFKPTIQANKTSKYTVFNIMTFKYAFENFDGIEFLLVLLTQSKDSSEVIIDILSKVLLDQKIMQRFVKIHGFEVIAHYMLNARQETVKRLSLIMDYIKTQNNSKEVSAIMMKYIDLNYDIWRRANIEMQELIFAKWMELSTNDPEAFYNIFTFADAMAIFYDCFKKGMIPKNSSVLMLIDECAKYKFGTEELSILMQLLFTVKEEESMLESFLYHLYNITMFTSIEIKQKIAKTIMQSAWLVKQASPPILVILCQCFLPINGEIFIQYLKYYTSQAMTRTVERNEADLEALCTAFEKKEGSKEMASFTLSAALFSENLDRLIKIAKTLSYGIYDPFTISILVLLVTKKDKRFFEHLARCIMSDPSVLGQVLYTINIIASFSCEDYRDLQLDMIRIANSSAESKTIEVLENSVTTTITFILFREVAAEKKKPIDFLSMMQLFLSGIEPPVYSFKLCFKDEEWADFDLALRTCVQYGHRGISTKGMKILTHYLIKENPSCVSRIDKSILSQCRNYSETNDINEFKAFNECVDNYIKEHLPVVTNETIIGKDTLGPLFFIELQNISFSSSILETRQKHATNIKYIDEIWRNFAARHKITVSKPQFSVIINANTFSEIGKVPFKNYIYTENVASQVRSEVECALINDGKSIEGKLIDTNKSYYFQFPSKKIIKIDKDDIMNENEENNLTNIYTCYGTCYTFSLPKRLKNIFDQYKQRTRRNKKQIREFLQRPMQIKNIEDKGVALSFVSVYPSLRILAITESGRMFELRCSSHIELTVQTSRVISTAFDDEIAAICCDNTIYRVDFNDSSMNFISKIRDPSVISVNGKFIACGTIHGEVYVYKVNKNIHDNTISVTSDIKMTIHKHEVIFISVIDGSGLLVSVSRDTIIVSLLPFMKLVAKVDLSFEAKQAVLCGKTIVVFGTDFMESYTLFGEKVSSHKMQNANITLACSDNKDMIFVFSSSQKDLIFQTSATCLSLVKEFVETKNKVTSMSICKETKAICYTCSDGSVLIQPIVSK